MSSVRVILYYFFGLIILKSHRITSINDQGYARDVPDGVKSDFFSKCYNELGCIETNAQWYDDKFRPVNFKPLDRHIIKTEFLVMNNSVNDKLTYTTITNEPEQLKILSIKAKMELIILIHDFTSNGYTGWIKHIAQVLFSEQCKDYTIISVDWQRGAEPPFDQAVANARVVALEIKYFIKMLKGHKKSNSIGIQLIGHGLGAHVAGYVGMTCGINIGKITALDPTGMRFDGMPNVVRLNPSCAEYVEVLHTDAVDSSSQGTGKNFGHRDFFINGAKTQPGCTERNEFPSLAEITTSDLEEGQILSGCSHKRSFKYYIEAIKSKECKFIGALSTSYENFLQNPSASYAKGNISYFDLASTKGSSSSGSYYLQTKEQPPFCLYPYIISVKIIGAGTYYGLFDFIFVDENDDVSNVTQYDAEYRYRNFTEKSTNSYVYYAVPPKLGKIKEAKMRWSEYQRVYCIIYCNEVISVKEIKIHKLEDVEKTQKSKLCPKLKDIKIENGEFTTFVAC